MIAKPSSKVLYLIEHIYGSVGAAANAWGIAPMQLSRFVQGQGVSVAVLSRISRKVRLPIHNLIVVPDTPVAAPAPTPAEQLS